MPAGAVALFLDALDGTAFGVAAFEEDPADFKPDAPWRVELLHDAEPDRRELAARLAPLAERAGLGRLDLTVVPVPREDWLARTAADFPTQAIGRFWLHGSHIDQAPPEGAVPLLIDAGLAFGSGEHATTRSCLRVLDRIARRRRLKRVLDLGCGSGVLAIAAAKCWPARVIAADNDPSAVAVAGQNAALNGVAARVRAVESDGLEQPIVRAFGPYDLILANILADPLVAMAEGLARNLTPGGTAVLSGLLDAQADAVLAAYRRAGLRARDLVRDGPWTTLVLTPRRIRSRRRRAAVASLAAD